MKKKVGKQDSEVHLKIKYITYTLMELREINYLKRRGLDIPDRLLNKKCEDFDENNEDNNDKNGNFLVNLKQRKNKEEISKNNEGNKDIKGNPEDGESLSGKNGDTNVIKFKNLNIDQEKNKGDLNPSLIKIDLNNINTKSSTKGNFKASMNNMVGGGDTTNKLKVTNTGFRPANK